MQMQIQTEIDMENSVFGYARVSSRDQNESRQIIALSEYDIPSRNLYVDKQSGKDFKRPGYQKLVRRLKPGDLLIIKSIDRLGRNYEEIIKQWRFLVHEKKADIIVLDMPLLNTTRHKDLLGTFISDLVLQLLSYIAENERNAIRQRQLEGIAAAKARGVRFGRPAVVPSPELVAQVQEWREKKKKARDIALQMNISIRSFYNYAHKLK